MPELTVGVRGTREIPVTNDNTAKALGSGGLDVFATPAMVALLEFCAAQSVLPFLPEGSSTVGTKLDIRHLAATPVGMQVRCETELIEIDRRRLVFSCKAYDDAGLIGEGTQERFVVNDAVFMEKAAQKMRG